jgi:hypothetical protein
MFCKKQADRYEDYHISCLNFSSLLKQMSLELESKLNELWNNESPGYVNLEFEVVSKDKEEKVKLELTNEEDQNSEFGSWTVSSCKMFDQHPITVESFPNLTGVNNCVMPSGQGYQMHPVPWNNEPFSALDRNKFQQVSTSILTDDNMLSDLQGFGEAESDSLLMPPWSVFDTSESPIYSLEQPIYILQELDINTNDSMMHQQRTTAANVLPFCTSTAFNPSSYIVHEERPALKIVEGLIRDQSPFERQRGGRGNTEPLPKHVIAIDWASIAMHNSNLFSGHSYNTLHLFCYLMGYERKSMTIAKIDTLKKVVLNSPMSSDYPTQYIVLSDLICQNATQFHCRKPFTLRFSLQDSQSGKELYFCESKPFYTITKRGEDKRADIERCRSSLNVSKKRRIDSKTKSLSSILDIKPSSCSCKGDELARIYFNLKLPPRMRLSSTKVLFGEKEARIYYFDQGELICEIPPAPELSCVSKVQVRVSLDNGKSFLDDSICFTYIPEKTLDNFVIQ